MLLFNVIYVVKLTQIVIGKEYYIIVWYITCGATEHPNLPQCTKYNLMWQIDTIFITLYNIIILCNIVTLYNIAILYNIIILRRS